MTVLGGTRGESLVEEMKHCSKTLAYMEAERESLLRDIEELEGRLASVNVETRGDGNAGSITAIQKVKNLRSELSQKEEKIRDIDERLQLEGDRLQSLSLELRMFNQEMNTVSNTLQTQRPTSRNRNLSLSRSPHRQQQTTEAQTPFTKTGESTMNGRKTNYTTSQLTKYAVEGNTHGSVDKP